MYYKLWGIYSLTAGGYMTNKIYQNSKKYKIQDYDERYNIIKTRDILNIEKFCAYSTGIFFSSGLFPWVLYKDIYNYEKYGMTNIRTNNKLDTFLQLIIE